MRVPRLFLDTALETGASVALDAGARRYLLRVLRLGQGDRVRVFNGTGGEYTALLQVAGRDDAALELTAHVSHEVESPLSVTLIQGISRGERMDYALQKAVELGVTCIVPVLCERSVVKLDRARAEKRHAHWQGVLSSACEQCGRNRLPQLVPPATLNETLAVTQAACRLVLDPEGGQRLGELPAAQDIALLVGPEGGLSDSELALARSHRFTGIGLGPRILRTETAAVAALAAVQTLWGDFA